MTTSDVCVEWQGCTPLPVSLLVHAPLAPLPRTATSPRRAHSGENKRAASVSRASSSQTQRARDGLHPKASARGRVLVLSSSAQGKGVYSWTRRIYFSYRTTSQSCQAHLVPSRVVSSRIMGHHFRPRVSRLISDPPTLFHSPLPCDSPIAFGGGPCWPPGAGIIIDGGGGGIPHGYPGYPMFIPGIMYADAGDIIGGGIIGGGIIGDVARATAAASPPPGVPPPY